MIYDISKSERNSLFIGKDVVYWGEKAFTKMIYANGTTRNAYTRRGIEKIMQFAITLAGKEEG